jgi:hypothetical protein
VDIDERLKELEASYDRVAVKVRRYRDDLLAKGRSDLWRRNELRYMKRLRNLQEQMYVLRLKRAFPTRVFLAQAKLYAVEGPSGKVQKLARPRIADAIEYRDGWGLLLEQKTTSTQIESAGAAAPDLRADHQRSAKIAQELQKEHHAINTAKRVQGYVLIKAHDLLSKKRYRLRIRHDHLEPSILTDYKRFPDRLLPERLIGMANQGTSNKGVSQSARVGRPSAQAGATKAVPAKGPGTPTPSGKLGGTGAGLASFGLGLVQQAAAARAIERRRQRTGYAPFGHEGYDDDRLSGIARWVSDPTLGIAIPLEMRFDVGKWRQVLRSLANPKRPGDTLTVRWQVGGRRYSEGTAFETQQIHDITVIYRKHRDARWSIDRSEKWPTAARTAGPPDLDFILDRNKSDNEVLRHLGLPHVV